MRACTSKFRAISIWQIRSSPILHRRFCSGNVTPWSQELDKIDRPSAVSLIQKLSKSNSLGFHGARDIGDVGISKSNQANLRVVDMACAWKRAHPDSVLLVRIGDFYESWGIDAIMLVQYAGLNPMGDSCRAGCPKGNIQQTLNSLTDAGLSVAVYEEANVVGSRSKKLKKERYLSQIVTPGRPIYLHDACLKEGDLPYRNARPYAAIQCSSGNHGCSLALFSIDSHELRVFESTTVEAIASVLEGVGGVASPMWVSVPPSNTMLSRLSFASSVNICRYPISLKLDSFIAAVSSDLKRMLALETEFVRSDIHPNTNSLRPLHHVAAQFLGVARTGQSGSPDLVKHILPPTSPFHCEYFLRNWLLCPPDDGGRLMHNLVHTVMNMDEPIPTIRVVPVDKLVRLLETRNGNIHFFLDVLQSVEGFLKTPKQLMLETSDLVGIVNKVSGLKSKSMEELNSLARIIQKRLDSVVVACPVRTMKESKTLDCEALDRFCRAKEGDIFGQVRGDFAALDIARDRLVDAIARSLVWPDKSLKYDAISDKVYVKDIDTSLRQTGEVKKKSIPDDSTRKRYSTDLILKAEAGYREAVDEARESVRRMLHDMCDDLCADVRLKEALMVFSHWAVVLSSVVNHTVHAQRRGWILPHLSTDSTELRDVWPYWLDPVPLGFGVGNNVTLECGKTSVLTAPNMSGKSTLIRSVGAAALLGNCGLMVPCKPGSTVGKFQDILVVSPSGDKPIEGMSAFGAEAEAMSVSLREVASTDNVLLLVDEFGRGTSGRDASSLSGAVLEYLSIHKNVACIWATHLHELFEMKRLENVVDWVQMDGYKLLSGKCTDSKGIETAKQRGFPVEVIEAAIALRGSSVVTDVVKVPDDRVPCPVKEIYRRLFLAEDMLMEIPKGHSPPPRITSSPVVYILRFADQFYIGETENFVQRLKAHSKRFNASPDQMWVLKQSDRSRARGVESTLIKAFLDEGVSLISTVDGFHSHSVAAN